MATRGESANKGNRETRIKKQNRKKKIIADGVVHAELHCFLSKALIKAGYQGIKIVTTPVKTEIAIYATKIDEVQGIDGRKLRELKAMICKRFKYEPDQLELGHKAVQYRGLSAAAQVESLKFKLLNNIPLRLAANNIIKSIMKDQGGARGCEIIISGKLKQQRAKTMKFKQGYMICTGQPKVDYITEAVRHVFFKQGIMGVKVKIMLPYDPKGEKGPAQQIPDNVQIDDPKVLPEDREIRTNQQQVQQAGDQQQQ